MAIVDVDMRGIGSLSLGAPAALAELPWNRPAARPAAQVASIGRQRFAPTAMAARPLVVAAPAAAHATATLTPRAVAYVPPAVSSSMPGASSAGASGPAYVPPGASSSMPGASSAGGPAYVPPGASSSMPGASSAGGGGGGGGGAAASMPGGPPPVASAPDTQQAAAPAAGPTSPDHGPGLYIAGGAVALALGLGLYLAVR